jgi:predicted dehydrogenase
MTVRLGVVGVGHLGQSHARIAAATPGASLAAVCDANRARAMEIAAKHGAPAFGDYRELAGRVDAVVVATPTLYHREVAEYFLEKGVPCFVEKPLAGTVADAEAIVEKARRKGTALQVGHIERFNPAWTVARPLMGRVRFVRAERVSPYPFRSTDIDAALDIMIHDLDLVLALARSPIARVEASGARLLSPTHDLVSARLAFEDGMAAEVTCSRLSRAPGRFFRTVSDESVVTLDLRARTVERVRRSEKLAAGFDPSKVDASKLPNPAEFLYGELLATEKPAVPAGEPLALEVAAFVEAVSNRGAVAVTGEDGVSALRAAWAVIEAAEAWGRSLK